MLPRRVLIVEDNSDNCELLALIFLNTDCEVHIARTGADGLTLIHSTQFHLGLFDIQLPDSNGLTLARHFHKQNPEAKSIILSALDDTHLIEKSAELGASAYVVKPFDLPNVLKVIQELETYPPGKKIEVIK